APLARRLLAGSLDRSIDVAATLELRGYELRARGGGAGPRGRPARGARPRSRFDRRFYAVGAVVLAAALAGKLLGADDFRAYPTVALGFGPFTVALSALLVLSGLAPLRRAGRRRGAAAASDPAAVLAALRGPAAAPLPGGSRA
ncbi:MAG TPA: hypothetical protein VF731_08815, partial [Solirubrobacterales bacterium]